MSEEANWSLNPEALLKEAEELMEFSRRAKAGLCAVCAAPGTVKFGNAFLCAEHKSAAHR